MVFKKILGMCVLTLLMATAALPMQGQNSNEVGLVIGAAKVPSQSLSQGGNLTFRPSLLLGAEYDRRLWGSDQVAVYGGMDFLASPFDVKLDQRPASEIRQYAFIFLTPRVHVKFKPQAAVAPWFSFGGGYARFLETQPGRPTVFKEGTNTGALQFGAGIDTQPLVRVLRIPIAFRLEVGDFYTGAPSYNGAIKSDSQHTVAFTGGFLLRF